MADPALSNELIHPPIVPAEAFRESLAGAEIPHPGNPGKTLQGREWRNGTQTVATPFEVSQWQAITAIQDPISGRRYVRVYDHSVRASTEPLDKRSYFDLPLAIPGTDKPMTGAEYLTWSRVLETNPHPRYDTGTQSRVDRAMNAHILPKLKQMGRLPFTANPQSTARALERQPGPPTSASAPTEPPLNLKAGVWRRFAGKLVPGSGLPDVIDTPSARPEARVERTIQEIAQLGLHQGGREYQDDHVSTPVSALRILEYLNQPQSEHATNLSGILEKAGLTAETIRAAITPETVTAGGYLVVVTDGVGGLNRGNLASWIANLTIQAEYYNQINRGAHPDHALVSAINRATTNLTGLTGEDQGADTTVAAAVVLPQPDGDTLVKTIYLGDSRIALAEKHSAGPKKPPEYRLVPLTKDHTWVQEALDNGILTADEAARHPDRNIVTRTVKNPRQDHEQNYVTPVTTREIHRAHTGATNLLLYTDGLSNTLSGEAIAKGAYENTAQELANAASTTGSNSDNIGVINVPLSKASQIIR